ncbi:MAG: DUF4350 domain-containing protein [Candidatus Hydrogenedentota bacterium]
MRNSGAIIVGAATGAAFLAMVYNLLVLEYESGEVYAAYSSFRPDPVGARALYESLDLIPGIEARRNLRELTLLDEGRDSTLLIIGSQISKDSITMIESIEQFAESGGRVVIAFQPYTAKPFAVETMERNQDPRQSDRQKDAPSFMRTADIGERWDFDYGFQPLETGDQGATQAVYVTSKNESLPIPGRVAWHTAMFFVPKGASVWKPIYDRGPGVVVMERGWGDGSIVLSSDSYPFSNEALRADGDESLLAWFIGPSHRVLFDETHLGASEKPGIISLARRYKLVGVAAAVGAVLLLAIWRALVSLTPKHDTFGVEARVQGRDATAGLSDLLRRAVPPRELLATCADEWEKAQRHATDETKEVSRLAQTDAGPLEGYRRIAAYLKERKRLS